VLPQSAAQGVSLERDVLICLLTGSLAAAIVHYLDFSLRIPGHAILRSVVPVMLGLALAPRRMSGTLIASSALTTSWLLRSPGHGAGMGALTSLIVIGPVLDACLWEARSGRGVWFRCALAGLITNFSAFVIRMGGKWTGWELGIRPVSQWWSYALFTYLVCGLVAGLLAGAISFRLTPRGPNSQEH
jgi:hypothetical protein